MVLLPWTVSWFGETSPREADGRPWCKGAAQRGTSGDQQQQYLFKTEVQAGAGRIPFGARRDRSGQPITACHDQDPGSMRTLSCHLSHYTTQHKSHAVNTTAQKASNLTSGARSLRSILRPAPLSDLAYARGESKVLCQGATRSPASLPVDYSSIPASTRLSMRLASWSHQHRSNTKTTSSTMRKPSGGQHASTDLPFVLHRASSRNTLSIEVPGHAETSLLLEICRRARKSTSRSRSHSSTGSRTTTPLASSITTHCLDAATGLLDCWSGTSDRPR